MITVVTATLPERGELLARASASVAAQTLKPVAHLIAVDHARSGGAAAKNLAAAAVRTEWLALLDDDDFFYPDHLQVLLDNSAGADVVYSFCDSTNDSFTSYNQPWQGPDALRACSCVSHNALVRTDAFRSVGGFAIEPGYDWRFWVRLLDAGGKFVSVPQRTWFYDLDATRWHESRPW